MQQADLVILVPMLGRAHRVEPLLASIRAATPGARVLFLTTPDDTLVRQTISRAGVDQLTVPYGPSGDYARKINAGYRHTTEPLMFTGADDLHFHPGWFERCLTHLTESIDDRYTDAVGVVGTNDLTNPRTMSGATSTHSLVARWYADLGTIDEPRKILHEGYPHEFVDDELVAAARHRDAYAHAIDAHVEHLHPMAGKAPMDDMYAQQRRRMDRGRVIFRRRQHLWT